MPYFSLENFSSSCQQIYVIYDIPVLSELTPPKMASSSSAVNDSVILTENDIPRASLAGLNPSSLKNKELRFWMRETVSFIKDRDYRNFRLFAIDCH